MPFSAGTFTKLFSWLTDQQRTKKIIDARLDAELDGIATGLTELAAPQYVVMSANSTLPNERVLTAGTGITITDGGAGSTVTITGGRQTLTANRTYYVRTDGSDSNTGLADSSGGAFLTIQKAIDTVAALDLSTFDVTIQVGDGTYTAANSLKTLIGAGTVTILGDATTPANVVVNPTSADCFTATSVSGKWKLQGLKLTTTTSGSGINASGPSVTVEFVNIDFGACPGSNHISANAGAIVTVSGDYSITGGANRHVTVSVQACFDRSGTQTITLTGTPAFVTVFANATRCAVIEAQTHTYSGSATGTRFTVSGNASINTGGGGANFFPGNAAGTATADGEYL